MSCNYNGIMLTKKEMKQVIRDYVSSLPNKDRGKSHIMTIGSKYVTLCELTDGCKTYRETLEEFYNNMPERWK